ncbi:MAG: hypothetical protein HC936_01770 [Leptolyngbyaceae cyanobacterium SU_3_3]|nr:hypothetical protein [Leptolyngbyaceae cyanobacterium SU_3_3]
MPRWVNYNATPRKLNLSATSARKDTAPWKRDVCASDLSAANGYKRARKPKRFNIYLELTVAQIDASANSEGIDRDTSSSKNIG